ncbi:MAG: class II aldolase/adducin family protein [Anaerolineales bacterium]|nr:class II aldolase/adducin family protein [Anaerolineales bacterium]
MQEIEQIAQDMATYMDRLVNMGLLHLKGGNCSARIGDDLIITRTKSFKKDLVPERLIRAVVDSDDPVENASSILPMHRAIYRATDAQAIIHAHSYYTTLLSFYIDEFRPIDENGRLFLGPRVRVIPAMKYLGWNVVSQQFADALTKSPVAILKWHGPFAIGESLAEAFHNIQAMEMAARLYLDTWRLKPVLGEPVFAPYIETPAWSESESE